MRNPNPIRHPEDEVTVTADDGRSATRRPLERTPLREQIRVIVRNWLISGELEPGQELTDRELGEQLGASRTPVREALLLLAIEGLVAMQPQGGYYVPPLEPSEAEQLYDALSLLERRSLVRGGVPPEEDLDRLGELDRKRRESEDAAARVEADRAWHRILLPAERVGEVFRSELDRLKNRVFRYEFALLKDTEMAAEGVAQHEAILAALRKGDLQDAGRLLADHWSWGAAEVLGWFGDEGSTS